MMDYLGGRKFIMGLIIIIAGIAIEIYGKNGMSANMVALLGAIYATFNAANALVTTKVASSETSTEPAAVSQPKLDTSEFEAKLMPVIQTIGQELGKINDNQARQERALQTLQEAQLATQKVLISSRQGV